MIAVAAIVSVAITIISFLLIEQSNQERVYAQNQTQATNFTQLFSTSEEFQRCLELTSMEPPCIPTIDVLYEDPTLLVLTSSYVDAIWKGVALAQKEGYQIDTMTSYPISSLGTGSTVNLLVAMSK